MKLQANTPAGLLSITGYDDSSISVAGRRLAASFILTPQQLVEDWSPRSIEQLDSAAMATLAEFASPIVLLGTGSRQRFPNPEVLQSLIEKRVGIEIMDNFAACRTYNILMSENREVTLAVLLEPPA